ncbi:anaerobic ribonucleoside-triphosphate reductase, partial [Candidatus Micrarchaeota archaeon]|nr:anaerobic ribonucleoside-triphosphate reductase [Candidatus Micrarchaeota archaeon]
MDVEKIAYGRTKENANVDVGPESIHKYMADAVSKQYALDYLFPVKYKKSYLSDAHLTGDIHIHDLDYFITRPYCAGHDIRYLLKYGLQLGKRAASAHPANTPEVLILHSAKWLGIMQANFSGAQAYASFNTLVAPFLKGLNEKQYKQLAQMFVFEMAQMSVARGAQVVFSDVNIDYGVPDILADAPAYGPKGQIDGTYSDYYDESVKFANALLDVYYDGDSRGVPFVFPKPLLKIRKENLKDPNFDEYLLKAHEVSAKMGSPYFLNQVTYEDESIAMCCRLKHKVRPEDLDDIKNARMRSTAIQNVTINLPRLAYIADGDDNKLQQLLEDRMEKAKEVHEIKNAVTQKLMDAGNAPMLTSNLDGYPYLRMDKVRHLIGILGLNDMVQYHTGEQLHESKDSLKFGWSFIRRMKEITDRFTAETNHVYGLEQTPAESTCYRFAKLDLKYFSGQAVETVKGNIENGGVYYTNSTHFSTSANVPLADKIKDEGLFHPLIEAGAISHIWLGEASPDPEALMSFTKKMMTTTMNQQFAYTRDICHCNDCNHTYGGTF